MVNGISRKKILVISVLFISFLMIPFLNNLNLNRNFNENEQKYIKDEDIVIQNLKTQDLTTDNIFSGIGAAWNVSHWAKRTDYDESVKFGNGTSYSVYMDLGTDWEGYQLNGTIKELYDKRNWVNGSFNAGPDDDNPNCPDNDSLYLTDWMFDYRETSGGAGDPPYENTFSGNYFNSTNDPSGTGNDCLELRMDGEGTGYDQYDRCWWESNFTLPRGDVIEGEVSLAMYPKSQYDETRDYGTHWSIQVILNGVVIDDKNLLWLNQTGKGDWVPLKLQLTNWLDNPVVFPNGVKNMSLRIQLIRNGGTLSYGPYGTYQQVLIDNVSLTVKSQVNATQIGLQMNEQPVSDSNEWGNGIVEQISSWTTTPLDVKFNSTEVRPSEMGGYEVEFKTDLNLFAKKMNRESHYQPNFLGTSFEVKNDSSVEWECYARVSVPTGYSESNMTIRFPEDVNITWISNAEKPNTNILKYCDNSTLGIIKVSNFSETPDGFWWVKGKSPNYCTELNIYNDVTGQWILNNTFLSGDSINITGKIESAGLDISGYIGNTKAKLYIKFPNGMIWAAENQIKQVNDNGFVYFDPIIIPNNVPNYEAGEYEAIITWNNSYSSFGLNETGIIYKRFNVIHDSILEPDQGIYFIENVIDDRIINIKVSYKDKIDVTAIENALVYTNFAGEDHNLTEISPGFYLFEFNASKANAGNNTLTIFANSTYFLNKVINVTVDVVKETLLTVENEFFTVAWNDNFTVKFNYTEKNTGSGINAFDDVNITWNGEYHLIQPIDGQYELECNTSTYDSLTLQSFIISINPYKYEAQSVLIRVQITELESSLSLFVNDIPTNYSDTIQVELGETINITVQYKDNLTTNHLPNATVELLGIDFLNDTKDQYTLIIGEEVLDQGITALTIFAQLVNYKPQSINFFIEVAEKETNLQLLLNSEEKTLDPVYNLTIGEILNITVKYTEQTGLYISNAVVQLIGEGILINLTKDDSLQQHSIELDTTDLKIGVNIFSIIAKATNYEIQTKSPIITINRISTLINISSQIKAEPGDDVTLEVILMDIYFGDTIKDAVVTYRWAYGQGELLDLNNTGIYEGFLENVPEGTYTITINAFKSDNYDFITKEITLIVKPTETEPGPDLSWLVYVLIGAIIGLTGIFALYQKSLKYPPLVRKIRKLKKKVRKNQKLKPILVNKRDEIINGAIQNQVDIIESIELEKNDKFQFKKNES